MSGHKKTTVTIEEREFQRLKELESQYQRLQREYTSTATIGHYQEALHQEYERISLRQQQYQGWLQGINDHVQQVESYVSTSLSQQEARFSESISEFSTNIWANVESLINQQEQVFTNQIDELRQQYAQQSRKFTKILRSIQGDSEKKLSLACSWIQAGDSILQFITDVYDTQKFIPGRFEPLIEKLNLAWQNLEAGIPEAALALAQNAYLESSALRLELEKLHHEWNTYHIAACERLEEVTILIEQNQRVKAIDLEGNELEQDIEVDYWSGGELSHILARIDELRSLLFEHYRGLTTDDLRYMASSELPALEQAVHDCRFCSRIEVLSSQIRINIADKALVALENQGFTYQQSSYDRHDQRSSFTATTQHLDGSEVIIKVIPSHENSMQNDLHVYSTDVGMRTRHELRLRAEAIRRTLSNAGLNIGPVSVEKESYRQNNINEISRQVNETVQKYNYR